MRYEDVGLFLQSKRISPDETVGAYMRIRGVGSPVYVQSDAQRTTISYSSLDEVDPNSGLSFARSEDSYNRTHFAESLKTFPHVCRRFSIEPRDTSHSILRTSLCRLYRARAAFDPSVRSEVQPHQISAFYRDK